MKKVLKLIQEWLEKAESDLCYAKASFNEFNDFYSQMCILCHDAVEKFLKAYIISGGKRPEPTHDLLKLLNECQKLKPDFREFVEKCRIPKSLLYTFSWIKNGLDKGVHLTKISLTLPNVNEGTSKRGNRYSR